MFVSIAFVCSFIVLSVSKILTKRLKWERAQVAAEKYFLSTGNLHKNHQHKNLVEKYIIVLLFALSLCL